jgi:hypothetical protein
MASAAQRRRQKTLERKNARRKAVRRVRAAAAPSGSRVALMRRAGALPLRECLVNGDWRDTRLARIVIARDAGPGAVAFGVFLVDLGCLGVKSAWGHHEAVEAAYEGVLDRVAVGDRLVHCAPALAARIIADGLAYAARLGFRPDPDYTWVRGILGDLDPAAAREEVPCGGENGRPLYIAGPYDDVPRIIAQLRRHVGDDGHDFVVPVGPPFAEDDDDLDDDLDDGAPESDLFARVAEVLAGYADGRSDDSGLDAAARDFPADLDQPGIARLLVPWALYDRVHDGTTVADHFVAAGAPGLTPEERAWLDRERAVHFRIWTVLQVERGCGILAADALNGEERWIHEVAGSRFLAPGHALLGRVVDAGDHATLCGHHPQSLPPAAAEPLIDTVRREMNGHMHNSNDLSRRLLLLWEAAVLIDEERQTGG